MSVNPSIEGRSRGPGRFLSLAGMGLLLLMIHAGTAAGAAGPDGVQAVNGTPAATVPVTTTETGITGGSVFFTTDPAGATILVDGVELGTSDFTYYFTKATTLTVRASKRGYSDYTGQVTVSPGRRVVFEAVLMPAVSGPVDEGTAIPTVTAAATTPPKSTLALPTPWPTSPQSSPVIPAALAGAGALAIGLAAARRR